MKTYTQKIVCPSCHGLKRIQNPHMNSAGNAAGLFMECPACSGRGTQNVVVTESPDRRSSHTDTIPHCSIESGSGEQQ